MIAEKNWSELIFFWGNRRDQFFGLKRKAREEKERWMRRGQILEIHIIMRSSHSLFFFVTNAPKPTKSLFWFKKAFEVFSLSQNSTADTEDKLASDSRIVFSLVRPRSNLPKSSSAAKLRHVMYLLLSCCGARSIESPPQLSQVWCFACPRSPWKKKDFNTYILFYILCFLN